MKNLFKLICLSFIALLLFVVVGCGEEKEEKPTIEVKYSENVGLNIETVVEVYENTELVDPSKYVILFDDVTVIVNQNKVIFSSEGSYTFDVLYGDYLYTDYVISAKDLSIKITYDLDGGACDNLPETFNGEVITLPQAEKEGFQFCGWYDQNNKLVVEIDESITSDLQLKALWYELDNKGYDIYDAIGYINKIPADLVIDDEKYIIDAEEYIKSIDEDLVKYVYNYYLIERSRAVLNEMKKTVDKINENIQILKKTANADLVKEVMDAYLSLHEDNKKYVVDYDAFTEAMLKVNGVVVDIDSYIPNEITETVTLTPSINGVNVKWETSDEKLLVIENNEMKLNKAYQNHTKKTEKVSVSFEYQGFPVTISKDVTIGAIVHKDIITSPVAAYVNIGAMSHYEAYNGRDELFSEKVYNTLDLVYYSFANPTSAGRVTLPETFHSYYDAVMEFKNRGARVLIVLGGSGTSKAFSDIAANDETLNTFANNLVDLVLKYNFDGIDIDWEYPGYESGRTTEVDKANYVKMFKVIREKLDEVQDNKGTDFILTSAIPGTSWGIARYDVPGLNKYLDYVNIMSYDLNNSAKATHLSSLYTSQTDGGFGFSGDYGVKTFVSLGFDKSKLILGAATYGKAYKITAGGATVNNVLGKAGELTIVNGVAGSFASGTIYYYAIKELLRDSNYKLNYEKTKDGKMVCSYIYNETNNIFITFESDQVFKEKYDYCLAEGIGIMCWSLPEDATDTYINVLNLAKKQK